MKAFKDFVSEKLPETMLGESHKHLLPKNGDFPYIPPKNCHHGAHRVTGVGKEVYADARGLHWSFDMLHKNHWDVSNPHGKAKQAYIRVDTSGTICEVRARSKTEGQQLLFECAITIAIPVQPLL